MKCFLGVTGWAELLCTVSASAQLKLEFVPEYFYWEERVNGAKFVDESGMRYGLELSYKQQEDHGWIAAGRTRAYYGTVDYNGGSQNLLTGVITPLKSKTDYYGGLLEGRFGYRFGLGEKQFLDVMGGLGIEAWLRRLRGSGGYDEYWFPVYLKAGVELEPSRQTGWVGALGVKVPVYTTEVADLGNGDVTTLHPRVNISGYTEAGYKVRRNLSVIAFAHSYWFGKSPSESRTFIIGNTLLTRTTFQPESKSYQVGAKLGWTF